MVVLKTGSEWKKLANFLDQLHASRLTTKSPLLMFKEQCYPLTESFFSFVFQIYFTEFSLMLCHC